MSAAKLSKLDLSIGLFGASPSISFVPKSPPLRDELSEDQGAIACTKVFRQKSLMKRSEICSRNNSNIAESTSDSGKNIDVSNSLLINALEGRYSRKRRLRTVLDDLFDVDEPQNRKKPKYHKSLLSMMNEERKSQRPAMVLAPSWEIKMTGDMDKEMLKRRPMYSPQKDPSSDILDRLVSEEPATIINAKIDSTNIHERPNTEIPSISNDFVAKIIPLDRLWDAERTAILGRIEEGPTKSDSSRRLLFAKRLSKNTKCMPKVDRGVNESENTYNEERNFQRNFIQNWFIDGFNRDKFSRPLTVIPKVEPPALQQASATSNVNQTLNFVPSSSVASQPSTGLTNPFNAVTSPNREKRKAGAYGHRKRR